MLNGVHWLEQQDAAITPDTRFVVYRSGDRIGRKLPGIEELYIAKFEGDDTHWQWAVKVGNRYRERHSEVEVDPEFNANDFSVS